MMKKKEFLIVALLNFLAAIAFLVVVFITDRSSWQWGFGVVSLLFAIGGVGNLVLHAKNK
ncbi:hypothetical protein PVOR_03025 [Paenibacillus vortex V453]|jgi:hypothetical protein|uniref:Uncharacterized protein n=2 Tax=Paenibacillus TaxID=44249 RepID=A0A2R9T114_9BACL|nr:MULTISPECIES: hypothetical protein [Paenibacillus]EFU43308.1 hypothetical protein PVOR_03025 [Paenibacillus vortex V453]MDH6671126.1 hypothetical protein [Paenibacillus sp. LBL]MPY15917.1 hypothetical protein [Paenibacillus glucanolyticus]